MSEDRKAIVCNYVEGTSYVAKGAKAYIVPWMGGNLPERIPVLVRSRGGRWIEKWESVRRLDNFRIKTLPPEHPKYDDSRRWPHSEINEEKVRWLIAARRELSTPSYPPSSSPSTPQP